MPKFELPVSAGKDLATGEKDVSGLTLHGGKLYADKSQYSRNGDTACIVPEQRCNE
jgi:hypothetical protein